MADAFKCDGCGTFHDGEPAVRVNTGASLPGTGGGSGFMGRPDANAVDVNEYCSQGCALEDNLGETARNVIEEAFDSDPQDPGSELADILGTDDDDDGDSG